MRYSGLGDNGGLGENGRGSPDLRLPTFYAGYSGAGGHKADSPSGVWDPLNDHERRRSPFLDFKEFGVEDSLLEENLKVINEKAGSFKGNAAGQALKELNSHIEQLKLSSVVYEHGAKAFREYMAVIKFSITKLSEAGQSIHLFLKVVKEVEKQASSQAFSQHPEVFNPEHPEVFNPEVFNHSITLIEGIVRELAKDEQPATPYDCFMSMFRRSSGDAERTTTKSAAIQGP